MYIIYTVLLLLFSITVTPANPQHRDIGNASCCEWPAEADDNLPMGGLFYGHPLFGEQTGNGILFGYEASRRFRVERDGVITAIRHNNRTLLQSNIDKRCRDNNIWCECKIAGLDLYTCGYHLANSYSLGNGGLVTVEIHADDGSSQHLPTGTALGVIKEPYIPLEIADQVYPIFEFESPVTVKAGSIYHLVYRQLNPPTICTKRGGYAVTEAGQCDRNSGLIGLNGIWFTSLKNRGPWLGETAAILTRHSAQDNWTLDPDNISWFEILYEDGVWTGDVYTYNDGTATAKNVGGGNLIRQHFTVADSDRQVNGIWLSAGRKSNTEQGALAVELIGPEDTVIARGSFESKDFMQCDKSCSSWAYAIFDQAVTLKVGSSYFVVFSAPNKARYVATSGFPVDYAPYNSKSRNIWKNSGAEFSADGGITWSPFSGSYYPNRDLSVLFTIVGMPHSLP